MPIKFQCPECSKSFTVSSKYAGRKAKCPCGAEITVPSKSSLSKTSEPEFPEQRPAIEHTTKPTKQKSVEKCFVCEKEKHESEGRTYTPREIVDKFLLKPGTAKDVQMRLAAVVSIAASIIQFDNPPGGADQPMNWICTACQQRYFSKATTGKRGCFIATACCGSPDSPVVMELTRFRDDVLIHFWLGRRIVALYYRLSPPIAQFLSRNSVARAMVKSVVIIPVFRLVRKM
jgi:hypothetical protein